MDLQVAGAQSAVTSFLWICAGVAISVLLPILRKALPQPKGGVAGMSGFFPHAWRVAKPYLALGAFSVLVSMLLVAFAGDKIHSPGTALLLGYAWDSTLQKLR
jgi:hypothetical protein